MNQDTKPTRAEIVDAIRHSARQEQFLEVVSAAEAHRRFGARLDRAPLGRNEPDVWWRRHDEYDHE